MRLAAFASLKAQPITVGLARDVLADVIPPQGYRPPIERIQEAQHSSHPIGVIGTRARAGPPPGAGSPAPG